MYYLSCRLLPLTADTAMTVSDLEETSECCKSIQRKLRIRGSISSYIVHL